MNCAFWYVVDRSGFICHEISNVPQAVIWPLYKVCSNQVRFLSQFWHWWELSINLSAFYNILLFYCNNLHLYHSGHMQPKSAFHFTHFCLRQCIAFSCMLCRFSLLDVLLRSRRLNHIKGQSPLLLERSFFSGCLEGYMSYLYNIYVIHAIYML